VRSLRNPTIKRVPNIPPSVNPGKFVGRGLPDVAGDADPRDGLRCVRGWPSRGNRRYERGGAVVGGPDCMHQRTAREARGLSEPNALYAGSGRRRFARHYEREQRVLRSGTRVGRVHRLGQSGRSRDCGRADRGSRGSGEDRKPQREGTAGHGAPPRRVALAGPSFRLSRSGKPALWVDDSGVAERSVRARIWAIRGERARNNANGEPTRISLNML
jgi:hypothetical protein